MQTHGHLLRILGVGFGLAVIIGNTIGAGIFRAPGIVAQQLPNTWLFLGVWAFGGVYALLGVVSLAELGAMIPRSGGQYVFARYALGEYAGFIVGWSDWISTCGTTAAVSLVIGSFAVALFPVLKGGAVVVAATVATVFALLQWQGLVWGSNIQDVTSLLKALAFLVLIVAGFALGSGKLLTAQTVQVPAGFALLTSFALSLQSVIYTFDGWNGAIYFSEEVTNPGHNIPRSMFSGVFTIIAIYLLVNLALLYVLPLSRIAGQEFAAGVAAGVIFGRHGDTIFRSLTVLSMLSGLNAYHLMSTRVLFAMSRDGLFSRKSAVVNEGGTPTVALFISAALAVLIIVFSRTFETVITALAFFFVANYTLSFISVFVLRRREPYKERPYRAWGYPWTTALALIGSLAFLVGAVVSDTRNSMFALLLLGVSYPIYRAIKYVGPEDTSV